MTRLLPARVLAAGVIGFSWVILSGAAPQAPSFPSQVELVMVDVVVTDKAGHPVPDLAATDFALAEGRRPQTIVSFRSVGSAAVSAEGAPGAAAEPKSPHGAPGQVFLIVFDDVHIEPLQTTTAQTAVERFLSSGVQPSDTVAILAPGAEMQLLSRSGADRSPLLAGVRRLRGLKIVDPCQQLTEFEAMRFSLGIEGPSVRRKSAFRENTACPASGSLDARALHEQARRRDSTTLAAIAAAFPAFQDAQGKRSVILVSPGFVDDPSLQAEFQSVLRRSLGSLAALYFADVRGLVGFFETERVGGGIALVEEAGGTDRLASETGGLAIHSTNDLGRALLRIADEGRVYYILGYAPSDQAKPGSYRRIEVRVRRPGLKVRARPGYVR